MYVLSTFVNGQEGVNGLGKCVLFWLLAAYLDVFKILFDITLNLYLESTLI